MPEDVQRSSTGFTITVITVITGILVLIAWIMGIPW
jgi:hypothetical protein